jgi:hypothetical protein
MREAKSGPVDKMPPGFFSVPPGNSCLLVCFVQLMFGHETRREAVYLLYAIDIYLYPEFVLRDSSFWHRMEKDNENIIPLAYD